MTPIQQATAYLLVQRLSFETHMMHDCILMKQGCRTNTVAFLYEDNIVIIPATIEYHTDYIITMYNTHRIACGREHRYPYSVPDLIHKIWLAIQDLEEQCKRIEYNRPL